MSRFLPLLILCAVWLLPEVVVAQGTGLVSCTGTDCSACSLAEMANTIIIWLFGMFFVLFAGLMTVAGFGLVTSKGNQSALEAAKSKFSNAIIGLLIMMSAWLIVDTIMKGLLKGGTGEIQGWGPWSKVECYKMAETFPASPDSTKAVTGMYNFQASSHDVAKSCKVGHSGSFATVAECDTAVAAITSATAPSYVTKKCDDTPASLALPAWSSLPVCGATPSATADGSFTYQGSIGSQAIHLSGPMQTMLTCMAKIVPGNVGEISGISDSNIISGSKTWAQCRLGQCKHTKNSYHYGTIGKCGDKSFAVDFGDEKNASVLCKAANSCGTVKSCSVHNGDHVHLDIPVSC